METQYNIKLNTRSILFQTEDIKQDKKQGIKEKSESKQTLHPRI